jgi:hypothetical protein
MGRAGAVPGSPQGVEMSPGCAGSRRTRVLAWVALSTALLTGCATAVPATHSPAATPSPSPSPSVDVAAAFIARIRGANSGHITSTATIELGPFRGDMIVYEVNGTTDFNGTDYRSTTSEIGGAGDVTSVVKVGPDTYVKMSDGPWLKTGGETPGRIDQILEHVTSVVRVGTETYGGRELIVLVPSPGVRLNPADFGHPEGAQVNLSFLADALGTPVLMRITLTWTQAMVDGSRPAKWTEEMAFDTLGVPINISRPDDVWTMHASKRFAYQIAYPGGWEVTEQETGDLFLSPEGYSVFVFSDRSRGATLNEWTAGSITSWQRQIKAQPQKNEAIVVGGQNARLLTYHAKIHNVDSYFLDAVLVANARGYDIEWTSDPGFEAAHRELFGTFLASVRFG